MFYTLYTLPAPVAHTSNGINGPETRMVRPLPNYPATFIQRLYSEGDIELWEDTAGVPGDNSTVAPYVAKYLEKACEPLWQAANDYQERYISGLAGGLLTIGVLQQKPRALAIMQWSGAHWDEYYRRKAQLMAGESVSYDFSDSGPMPFSVPELREELGL